MATKYVRSAGGAWGDAATWALTSGGTEVTTVPTAADDVVTDSNSGASTVGANISVKSFVQTGTPGAVTNNGFTISSAGNVTLLSGKYIAENNAARIIITAAGTLTTGGNAMGGVTLAAAAVCGDNLTFIADKLCTLIINGNFLDVNGKTISGNSATNRLIIRSDTIGTPRTVTVNGGSFANCDFQDIAFANGGADLDLSAGSIGNCGGNSMSGGGTLTFPPVRTCTFDSTGGNWSDAAKWTDDLGGHAVPLAHHLARTQPMSAGQTITVDMPRLPDTDFSGCGASNLPSVVMNTSGLTYSFYGSLNLTGVGTFTRNKTAYFDARTNITLTTNGNSLGTGDIIVRMPGATLTFADAVTTGSAIQVNKGTVTTNYNVTAYGFYPSLVGTTINMGAGVWTITGNTGWGANGTINAGTSTIHLSYTGATATTFAGGTNTYNDITIAPGSGVLTFSGAFTFHDMVMSSAGTRSIVFTKGTTYTMTGDSFLNGAGVDDAPIITPSLLNGGFESAGAGGADVFADWTETATGTSTITDDTVTPYSGGHACKLTIDGAGSQAYINSTKLVVGRLYKIEFYAKADTAATQLNLYVGTASGPQYTYILPTEWTKYTVYELANGVNLRFRTASANRVAYLDDVTVTPLNSVLIQSSGAGEPFTLSKASGLVASNYLAIKDSIATGGAVWLAGYNSTNISGNTGWHFNSPASGAGVIEFVGTATAKALCRGIPAAAEIVFNATATAKALCSAAGSGVIEFVGACSAIVAAWKTTGLFKATERYIGQYFKASKRRK